MPASMSLIDDDRLEQLFAPAADAGALGLAVSGGADSLALLLLAERWAKSRQVRLVVYSVDHGLRVEAADEVRMVLRIAADCGVEARGLAWAGPHPTTGVQAAARTQRYRLIGDAMERDGVSLLLTAHHLHDQAETVLMRLAHGSGLDGLRGMSAFSSVEQVRIFRPLLSIAPGILRQMVAAAGLVPVEDQSNSDTHYERVRWRAMLSQLSALGLDPRRLSEFAMRAGQAQDVVAKAADAAQATIAMHDAGGVQIELEAFARLPPAVGALLLSRLLAEVGDGHKSRAIGSVEVLQRALVSDAPFRGRTLHGCQIRRARGVISLVAEPGRAANKVIEAVAEPLQM